MPRFSPVFFKFSVLGILQVAAPFCPAQTASPTPAATTTSQPGTNTDYDALLKEAIDAGLESFEKTKSATPDEYRDYITLLSQITEIRALNQERASSAQILKSQAAEIQKTIEGFTPPEITSTSGLEIFDNARAALWQSQNWLDALNKIGATKSQQEKESFDTLKQQQATLSTLENQADPTPRDVWLRDLQKIRVHVSYLKHLSNSATDAWKADVELQNLRIKLAQLKLDSMAGKVQFPSELIDQKRAEMNEAEAKISQTGKAIEAQVQSFSANNPAKKNPRLATLLLTGLEKQLQFTDYKRVILIMEMHIWQLRFEIWNASDSSALEKAERDLASKMQDIQTWKPLISGLRSRLEARRQEATSLLEDSPQANIRDFADKAFIQEAAALSNWEDSVDEISQLITLSSADLANRKKSTNIRQNIDIATTNMASSIEKIWNTQILELTDSVYVDGQLIQRPSSITLGMFLSALVILAVGAVISSAFSRWFRQRLTQRFHLEANTGEIVQKFSHYLMLACASLVALAVVKIPLTIFALLGGAAAIAVGFGTQQLVSNLISGFIILFERPIRINDFVDVANFTGVVTAIGTRCSKLRRGDGVEILIPNSTILQSTLVNWTLTDSDARFELLVGINYGSKVENAVQIILDIANAHPDILTKYPPEVYFHDFGNDAIVLRLFYWVDRSRLGIVNRVPSELRMSIYNAFNAAGIGLAFPQRDVHLQTTQPISVEILGAKNN